MSQQRPSRDARSLALGAGLAVLLLVAAGCGDDEPAQPGGPGGTAGSGGSGGGRAGTGGASTGSGTGGAAGMSGSGGGGGSGGGMAGTGGSGRSPDARRPDAGRSDTAARADGGGGDGGRAACGLAGLACCADNLCTAPATPSVSGMAGGTTVLELKASGGDPYALFREKNLLPIDGPDSGYITDTGSSFLFVLHQNGAEETVSSGAQRQRNEVTVNPPNPAIYKGTRGDTMSYTWRFKIDQMNANPTWCDVFQIKQHGPLGVAPYFALEAYRSDLTLDTQRGGRVASVPLSAVMNTWINASMTLTYADAGKASLTLKKDDGTVVMSFVDDDIDLSDTDVDFVRPKWGLYRNKANGAGEAAVHYNDMKIIRGTVGPSCACR